MPVKYMNKKNIKVKEAVKAVRQSKRVKRDTKAGLSMYYVYQLSPLDKLNNSIRI